MTRGADWVKAAQAVSEEAIWGAVAELSKRGFFVEPMSATAPAVLSVLRREGAIASGDSVVVVLTGNGLKATDKIVDHYFSPNSHTPEAAAFALLLFLGNVYRKLVISR